MWFPYCLNSNFEYVIVYGNEYFTLKARFFYVNLNWSNFKTSTECLEKKKE